MRVEVLAELDGMTVRCEIEGARDSVQEGVEGDPQAVARMTSRAAAAVVAALTHR